MKRKLRVLTILILVLFILSLTATAFAQTVKVNPKGKVVGNQTRISNYKEIDRNKIKMMGKNVAFDVPPVIKGGRTLVPVRAIMNGFGAGVAWSEEQQKVTITNGAGTIVVILSLGSNEVTVNGNPVTIDVPAGLINSRTFVPLRFLAETFGLKVVWTPEGEIIIDGAEGDENQGCGEDDEDGEADDEEDEDEDEDDDTEQQPIDEDDEDENSELES
jgi:hypothetical protein